MILDNLPTISTVVIAILGVVGGVGFWQYRISRKDAPVRKQEADMAVAEKSQQMAMAIAERLDKDYAQVRQELTQTQAAVAAQGEEIAALQKHGQNQDRLIASLRKAVQAFSDAWDDLVQHWDHYRLSETPPRRPAATHSLDSE